MADQEQRSGKFGRIVSILALLFFLIFLPLGSYIYLKKGYEYQKEAMKDLRKEQQMTNLTGLELLHGQEPELEIGENFYLLGLISASVDQAKYANVLKRLHEQFDLPENIEFWTVFVNGDQELVRTFQTANDMPVDTAQLLYWGSDAIRFQTFTNSLALRAEEQQALADGLIVLVDDSLYVRQAYPITDELGLQQLVERTAILLPERNKPKPELRREAEL